MLRNVTRELERRRQTPRNLLREHVSLAGLWSQIYRRRFTDSSFATAAYDKPHTPAIEPRRTNTDHGASQTNAKNRVTSWRDVDQVAAQIRLGDDSRPSRSLISRHQDVALEDDHSLQGFRWSTTTRRRRQVERKTKLSKSWRTQTPNILLKRILDVKDDSEQWRRYVAATRSMRLPVILLQMLIYRQESQTLQNSALLELLPNEKEWTKMMQIVSHNGHTPALLEHYLYVLQGRNDDERCERFLDRNTFQPMFILNFLLRPSSNITKPTTLHALIEYCQTWHDGRGSRPAPDTTSIQPFSKRNSMSVPNMSPEDFRLTMSLLARHCLRLQPRLMIKLAEVTAQYIENMATFSRHLDKIYRSQCRIFNEALKLLQPQSHVRALQKSMPNAYFWEAQRMLLAMSANLERPLLVNADGFRSIREVLSGMSKNQTEIHSSLRHALTWPPYLRPAHGMDEAADPEDNWTRTVHAGMMMQEAGFAKEERDDAIDILQGMMPDGGPTIQQRSLIGKTRDIGIWEASIKATRNAQEAWERFQNPLQPGSKPGSPQYAAMFEKLVLLEASSDGRVLPGDKALNFPTHIEANLAEFERARRRPPSVAQLYQQMRLDGVRPQDSCLRILVANADSLDTAHQYLKDSTEKSWVVRTLTSDDPDPKLVRRIDISLFSAYIQASSRLGGRRAAPQIMKAIRLTGIRLESEHSRWVPFIWGTILRNLSQHHRGLRITLAEQLSLFLDIIERIDARHGIPLSTFIQFSKCIRKASRRELDQLYTDLAEEESGRRNPLYLLYDWQARAVSDSHERVEALTNLSNTAVVGASDQAAKEPLYLFSMAAIRMKQLFSILCSQEKETERLLQLHNVSALDRIASRSDPVRCEHAHEYMLSLAHVGEFREMAKLLKWLIQEWGRPEVVEAIGELDEPPSHADFFEVLCVFRLLAEPMLEGSVVASVRDAMEAARLEWTWPDDEAVETYGQMQGDEPTSSLSRVLERVRCRQKLVVDRQEEKPED